MNRISKQSVQSKSTPAHHQQRREEEEEEAPSEAYSEQTNSTFNKIMNSKTATSQENCNTPPRYPQNQNQQESSSPEQDYSYHYDDQEENTVEDATKSVHESHYALLYLLSNPEEFHSVLSLSSQGLKEWNEQSSSLSDVEPSTPLPFAVFAPDAEVVLPQAHTASQLFGLETIRGIELEAAAGIHALSQLFLRWLALMPAGDHCNIIDPPGLTVMRIVGGRYRVTGAHRVVWTWMNDFLLEDVPLYSSSSPDLRFSFGDLVTMTIIDVFETDKHGKLLSYCPTFDNRSITKTTVTRERLSKESHKMNQVLSAVGKSRAANQVNKAATFLGRIGLEMARGLGEKIGESLRGDGASSNESTPVKSPPESPSRVMKEYPLSKSPVIPKKEVKEQRSEHYVSDDETTSADTR